MYKYVIKRILMTIPIMLLVILIVFSIMELTPGEPARNILGLMASQESVDTLTEELGLNRSFFVRLLEYVGNMFVGDFGESYKTGNPVFEAIWDRFPTSLLLAVFAVVTAALIGVPIGILSAVKQYSATDIISTVSALIMASVPSFWLGNMLILLLSVELGILPPNGVGSFAHYVMPTLCLAFPCAAQILRLTRSTMLEVIRQDYIRTAIAKGAEQKRVILIHALKNALLPVVTVLGVYFGALIGGTIIVESVFSIPGLGTLVIESIRMKDIPQVMGTIIFLAGIFCAVMVFVDIIYAYLDPRIKAKYTK